MPRIHFWMRGVFIYIPGGDLLSHTATSAISSALKRIYHLQFRNVLKILHIAGIQRQAEMQRRRCNDGVRQFQPVISTNLDCNILDFGIYGYSPYDRI